MMKVYQTNNRCLVVDEDSKVYWIMNNESAHQVSQGIQTTLSKVKEINSTITILKQKGFTRNE